MREGLLRSQLGIAGLERSAMRRPSPTLSRRQAAGGFALRTALASLVFSLCAVLGIDSIAAAGQSSSPISQYGVLDRFGTAAYWPVAGLLRLANGQLWGTTSYGGSGTYPECNGQRPGCGTVFRLIPSGKGYTFQFVHSFNGFGGSEPMGQLVQAADGRIYGTTFTGGTGSNGLPVSSGTIFSIDPISLAFLSRVQFPTYGPRVASLSSGLVAAGRYLYGTSNANYEVNGGTIFRYGLVNGEVTTLYSFPWQINGFYDGQPNKLLLGSDGRLYGTTLEGGAYGWGQVFAINLDGSNFTLLHSFSGTDGAFPLSELIQVGGLLYGTTWEGNAYSEGEVFSVALDGSSFAVRHAFGPPVGGAGSQPAGAVLLGSDGNIYGTTQYGGAENGGVAFRMALDGSSYAGIHEFGSEPGDGVYPVSALIEDRSGVIYGTTQGGGGGPYFGSGTVFGYSSTGVVSRTRLPLIPSLQVKRRFP